MKNIKEYIEFIDNLNKTNESNKNNEETINYVNELLYSILDYGFRFDDITEGTSVSINNDISGGNDSELYFDTKNRKYHSFTIKMMSILNINIANEFLLELKEVVTQIEEVFNIKFECVYIFTSFKFPLWIKKIEDISKYKSEISKNSKFELMFRI